MKSKQVSAQSFNLPSGQLDEATSRMAELIRNIREAQGEPQGEAWEFDVPRLQEAILNGSVWGFEGSVGRGASDALESGACFLPSCWKDEACRPLNNSTAKEFRHQLKNPIRDYYGNLIPYRELLKPGSKGTLENSARFYGIGDNWD